MELYGRGKRYIIGNLLFARNMRALSASQQYRIETLMEMYGR